MTTEPTDTNSPVPADQPLALRFSEGFGVNAAGGNLDEWETVEVPTLPQKHAKWVAVVAEIRENATGVVREYEDHELLRDGDTQPSDFGWSEGNSSCDCNRRLFFARSAGEESDEDWDAECSDGLYAVRLRNKKSGRVYYSEFDA